jgi:ankyrin repeat protein/outer membrane protein OmpA-like peptidoglycan-associated protein
MSNIPKESSQDPDILAQTDTPKTRPSQNRSAFSRWLPRMIIIGILARPLSPEAALAASQADAGDRAVTAATSSKNTNAKRAQPRLSIEEQETLNKKLLEAVEHGDTESVRSLLDKGAKAQFSTPFPADGRPPHICDYGDIFITALSKGRPEIVQMLIEHGANVNARSIEGDTALKCVANRLEIAKILIEHGADVNARNDYGDPTLMWANLTTAKLFLDHGAKVNARNDYGDTTLMHKTQYPDFIRLLLEHGADVNAKNKEGQTALMFPGLYHDFDPDRLLESDRLLLEHGADPTLKDDSGKTALDYCPEKEIERKKLLMEAMEKAKLATVPPEKQDKLDEWLNQAVDQGNAEKVRAFLEQGANPNHTKDDNHRTLLYLARGNTDIARLLIEHGAKVNARNDLTLRTALFGASLEVTRLLLEHGAKVDLRDNEGHTALTDHYIVHDVEADRLLLEHGANPAIKDNSGKTALDYCPEKETERRKLLMEAMEKAKSRKDMVSKTSQRPVGPNGAEKKSAEPSSRAVAEKVRGDELAATGDNRSAREAYMKAQAVAEKERGDRLVANWDYRGAREAYLNAIKLSPGYAAAFNELGVVSANQVEAAKWFKKAIDADPSFSMSQANLGYTLRKLGRFAEAIAAYKAYVNLVPKDPMGPFGLGEAYKGSGDKENALAAHKLCLALAADQNHQEFVRRAEVSIAQLQKELASAEALKKAEDFAKRDSFKCFTFKKSDDKVMEAAIQRAAQLSGGLSLEQVKQFLSLTLGQRSRDGQSVEVKVELRKAEGKPVEQPKARLTPEQLKLVDNYLALQSVDYKKSLVVVREVHIQIKKSVHFSKDGRTVLEDSFPLLDEVAGAILANEYILKLRVEGHTDNQGKKEELLKLSQNEAKAVMDYLVSKGIDPTRLIAEGYGDTKPVAPNLTTSGRELNRRMEFMIVEPGPNEKPSE